MDNGAAIPPDAIEWTYCIFHQKLRVYKFSTSPSQRDEIEHVVASYAMDMNPELYKKLADAMDEEASAATNDGAPSAIIASESVCWAAPRPGVLVTAPDMTPVMV